MLFVEMAKKGDNAGHNSLELVQRMTGAHINTKTMIHMKINMLPSRQCFQAPGKDLQKRKEDLEKRIVKRNYNTLACECLLRVFSNLYEIIFIGF